VYSKENEAQNFQETSSGTGGDAIAGTSVVVGSLINSNLDLDLESKDNDAYSKNGNAIIGNYVKVGVKRNGSSVNFS